MPSILAIKFLHKRRKIIAKNRPRLEILPIRRRYGPEALVLLSVSGIVTDTLAPMVKILNISPRYVCQGFTGKNEKTWLRVS
jgi:hypothetical protein